MAYVVQYVPIERFGCTNFFPFVSRFLQLVHLQIYHSNSFYIYMEI
jgi:hypothetical protein